IAANDFIKSMLNMFCMSLFPYKGKLQIRSNNDVLNNAVAADWSSKLIDSPEILTEAGKSYSYSYPGEEPYTATEAFVSVPTTWAMEIYPYTLDDNQSYEERFFIEETNQRFIKRIQRVYSKVLGSSGLPLEFSEDEIVYEILDTGLGVTKNSDMAEKYSVEPNVELLPIYPVNAFTAMENHEFDYTNMLGMMV